MEIRAKLKGLVHQELFSLEPAAKQAFRYALPDDCLRHSFARMGRPPASKLAFSARESRNPLEHFWFDAKPRYYAARSRLRRWYSQHTWAVKKRWDDKPRDLLINLGAEAVDFVHNLTSDRPFPLPDNSRRLFYSEHVIEHLKDERCEHIFREGHRCLKSGGGLSCRTRTRFTTVPFSATYS